ncbi:PDZ and LIM domain protein 5 isoform X5 [Bufo gargarizans]|uniref:PDZ and LIM domain protein 5 isoform X5 n=1 Tax=Bufo gargarizans TaxID=30331 RepID=UPI001CF192E5|nr:PDZ and LIM domain protein 5 isoform X5 [Bufo gargarizans]
MSNFSVSLVGPSPWGFRLQGGKDFNMPLTISRLNDGGKAAKANIGIGDVVLSIDGLSTDGMTHLEAQNKIKACAGSLHLTLQKAVAIQNNPNPPQTVTPVAKNIPPKRPPRQHILDVETDFHHTPTFSDASKKRLVDNTEDWHPRTGTSQSRSFRILAQMTGTENLTEPEPETVDRNKKSQVINGDISMSAGLHTDSHAIPVDVAMCTTSTQTEDVLSTSEPPTVNPSSLRSEPTSLEKSGHKEILPVSSFTTSLEKTSVDPGPSNNPQARRALFDNPLESLPKCAPFPPATVRTLNVTSQVATISKTASVYMRSTMIVPSPVVETTYAEIPVGNGMSVEIGLREKCTVSTQTYDPPAPQQSSAFCAAEPLASKDDSPPKTLSRPVSIGFSGRQTSAEHTSSFSSHITLAQTSSSDKKPLMENPLDQLPKSAPCPPLLAPLTEQNSKRKTHAVAAVSAVVGARARLSDPFVYRSLLDALIIEPVIRQPVPSSKLGRRSTGLIGSEPFMSESLEPAPVTRTAGASSKIMPASYNPTPSAYKPSSSTTAAKPGGWQPGPSTGRVSSAPSTVKPATNNKPFVPPPLDDQDTLFQRAEHIPAGTRTPMCAKCNLVIRGPFLLALGKSWHPEEFNCAHCKKSMVEMGFAEEKGFLYCEICYEKFFAPDCARCQRKILGEIINALKQTWHVSCFVCVACQKPIHNSVFHLEDGDPYCEMDYYSLFGTMCHGCEFPIEAGDRFLEALGHTWHNTCFVCSVCCESLEGQTFFSKKDKPLCKKHAHAVNI